MVVIQGSKQLGSGKRGLAVAGVSPSNHQQKVTASLPRAYCWALQRSAHQQRSPVPPSDLGCDRQQGNPSRAPAEMRCLRSAANAVTLPSGGPGFVSPCVLMCAHDPDSHIRKVWRLGVVLRAKLRSPRHPHICPGPGTVYGQCKTHQCLPVFTPIPGAPHQCPYPQLHLHRSLSRKPWATACPSPDTLDTF
ncbi:hypothetical protein NDU88_006671 [Pleurodeles waltl]|uniref:Uncharacterized protein n=1 Tax=Pleurodeles waltl TaxID=8319 RepID=A0AAV7QMM0_PLEWA|nr:hypothetical protein NDU88_006671 [Pleurodeles waltl]